MKRIIVIIFFGFIITSCIPPDHIMTSNYSGPTKVPVYKMQPTVQFHGFTLHRPTDERWYYHIKEASPIGVIFRFEPLSSTHTFFASIWGERIAITPSTKEELKDYVDKGNLTAGPRHEIFSYESKVSEIQGQWAIIYSHRILD